MTDREREKRIKIDYLELDRGYEREKWGEEGLEEERKERKKV